MNSDINFNELWNRREAEVPGVKELFQKANSLKRKNLYKLIFVNVLMVLTTGFILWVWYFFQPEMITTKIGIVLIILAMAMFLFVSNRSIPLLRKENPGMDSSHYLQQLLKLKERNAFLQKTMLNIYFAMLLAGICLYMIEYTMRMTMLWAMVTYGITLLWIAFNWFYIRPRAIRKQQATINDLIANFERLNKQLTMDS